MANEQGWWARKMAGQPQQTAPVTQSHYQPWAPSSQWAPAPLQQQTAPMPPQYHQQGPVAPQNFAEAIQAVQAGVLPTFGADAARTERNACPSCGSPHFFSRRNGGGVTTQRGVAAPAPQCFHCGYNGLFSQADESTWAVGA